MAKKMARREFFEESFKLGISAAAGGSLHHFLGGPPPALAQEKVDMAVVSGGDYFKNTVEAVKLLGGMEKFVPKNSRVSILANVQSRHPGTYTKPEIVRAVIRMCKNAEAAEVNCLSWLTQKHWEDTGLGRIVAEEGANLRLVDMNDESLFRPFAIPKGKALREAKIMEAFFANDVFINMPVTKDHAGNKFTGTMKNLMGLNFRVSNRSFHHDDWKTNVSSIEYLDQCIADLNTVVRPTLCIVDATEFITTNGPMGPGELIKPQKVIAGKDRVAIDAYCTTLWGLEARDIFMIRKAYEHKLGEIDLKRVRIKEVTT
ncbi:MAG: DUF362 domain-containing protein [Candidatus Aminicenantales bacterium]